MHLEIKVGDKVRCKPGYNINSTYRDSKSGGAGYVAGQEFIVGKINHLHEVLDAQIAWPGYNGNGVFLQALELVTETKSSIGDILEEAKPDYSKIVNGAKVRCKPGYSDDDRGDLRGGIGYEVGKEFIIDRITNNKDKPEHSVAWPVSNSSFGVYVQTLELVEESKVKSNINQKEHEPIKVHRKTKTIASGERRTGNTISGRRSRTAIGVGHLSHKEIYSQ